MASLRVEDGVAVVTFTGADDSKFPWGTLKREHRLNPVTVGGLSEALDQVEKMTEVSCLVVTGEGKFWSNGMDLGWVDKHPDQADAFAVALDTLMERLLCFPIPTVAALNGHWCAAGGMTGLCFDFRVMDQDRGFFFVPGVDLGLVYSSFQVELMKAKLPTQAMQRDVICFNSKRWRAADLLPTGLVDEAVPADKVLPTAMAMAQVLKPKGQGAARKALGPIKRRLYRQVLAVRQEGTMQLSARKAGDNYAPPPSSKL